MNPRLKSLLATFVAAGVAVWVGVNLAHEEHLLAFLIAGVSLWAALSWTLRPRSEAWLLAFLLVGYIIGNRGFAQITPVAGVPLFWGELGLGFVLVMIFLRGAVERTPPLRGDALNGWLLAWVALGCARIGLDVRAFGFVAVRDFAVVYYALFFFAAQSAAGHPVSLRLLAGTLVAAMGVLPVTAALVQGFPDFFLSTFTLNRVPVIFYKEDLVGTFLFAGFLLLLPRAAVVGRARAWRWVAALAALVVGLVQLSRAGMLGLMVGLVWLAWAGRWRPARTVVATMAAGALFLAVYSLLDSRDITQTRGYAVYEQLKSIVDVQGTGRYQHRETADSGDNNRFRLVWWRTIAEETLRGNPLFGLGFGYDLARGFLQEYSPLAEDFTARSPHSVLFTTLGRMGLLGLAGLAGLAGAVALNSVRLVRLTRRGRIDDGALTLHAACWVIAVSSCFGVVLEGPMGAIPFWIMLGLAHHETVRALAEGAAADSPAAPPAVERVPESAQDGAELRPAVRAEQD